MEDKKGQEYLEKLKDKYEMIGQDFYDYMEGLVQSNGLNYWDYIHIDALLGLQLPRTDYADEVIFITYHQICELYFKLIKLELAQLTDPEKEEYKTVTNWYKRIGRVNNYFKHLCSSFDIMKSGMDAREFRKFRMALLPASGFQGVQFRHIEIMSSNLNSLLGPEGKNQRDVPLEKLYDHIYWKAGGINMARQKKTLTLLEFEKKYDKALLQMLDKYKYRNLNYLYYQSDESIKQDEQLKTQLRKYDQLLNVFWKMSHLMASSRHLPAKDLGTGGTNWRKYLPPKFQKVMFFETLWTQEEKDNWGKSGVLAAFKDQVEKDWMKPNEY